MHRLREPEQFGIAIAGANLSAEFLAPQKEPTRIEQFHSPFWALDLHDAHVKARIHAPLPPGWVSFGLLRGPAVSRWHGVEATGGVLLCDPPGGAIDGCIVPGFDCVAIHVPVPVWERCRSLAGVEDGNHNRFAAYRLAPSVYGCIERELRALCQRLRQVQTRPSLVAAVMHDAERIVTDVAITAWEMAGRSAPPHRESLRNRARLARRAESWLRDRLTDAVQIPDLCLALRVSRRELEYAFRSAFDQSPRDFLQALRLNAIRSTLRRGERPVLQAALDYGITHPGRFAAQYRALFHERPSETYRRRRE